MLMNKKRWKEEKFKIKEALMILFKFKKNSIIHHNLINSIDEKSLEWENRTCILNDEIKSNFTMYNIHIS